MKTKYNFRSTPPLSKELDKDEEEDFKFCLDFVNRVVDLFDFFNELDNNRKLPDYISLCADLGDGGFISLYNYRQGIRFSILYGVPQKADKGGIRPITFRMEPITIDHRYVKPDQLATSVTFDTAFITTFEEDKTFNAQLQYLPDEIARWRRHMRLTQRFIVQEFAMRVVDQFEMTAERLANALNIKVAR